MFRGGTANFDKLLDRATSHLSLEPDLASIIQISDSIRQGDCPPKYALASIKKKLMSPNSHTANYALLVLESVVKNCGSIIHDEIATKQFMDILRDVLKTTSSEEVKTKTLEIIQAWAHAFRMTPKYRPVQDMMMSLKSEGFKFPLLKESDAMFAAESAPEWTESATCHRCRVPFGTFQRKHHCRACGNAVCGKCSEKQTTLPKFGIEKEVRVCDTCYDQNKNRASSPSTKSETEQLPAEYLSSSLAQQKQAPMATKSAEELKEDEDLQLALALSQSEAEAKEKETKRPIADLNNSSSLTKTSSVVKEEEPEDEELAKYLNRSYWEQRQSQPADRKQSGSPDRYRNSPPSAPETPTHQMENGLSESQLAEFVSHLKSQVDVFVNRMKSNSSRGRSISNDSSVQSLFMNMTNNHSKLLEFISQQEEMRVHFEGLQDKLSQVKDAMAALEALRDEHQEKLRREAEEAERVKQIQMAHKLQIMRKKKQEYLQQQRQLAIQKVQEQEREMQMRKEQQKQQYMMGGYNNMMGYPTPQVPGYPPQPGYPMPNTPYMPPGYPPMHQGMPMPQQMQQGRVPGQQSLPPQMSHTMQQPQSLQQPMGMPLQHSMPPQSLPMIPQQMMGQRNLPPQMINQPQQMHLPQQQQMSIPGNLQQQIPPQQLQNNGNLPQQMQNTGGLPQQMQTPGGLPHQIQNPNALPQQIQNTGALPQQMQNPGMPPGMGQPIRGPGMMQAYPGMQQHPNMVQPMQMPPHNNRMMQQPGVPDHFQQQQQQQMQQQVPGTPQEQSTAELIRFD